MTVRLTPVSRQFEPTHKSKFKNILVNGCSYTWNNAESYPITWPYYLRDLCNFEQVFDCSQGASGSNHIFTSTIYEIETNQDIHCDNTLVLIMWSGLTRVDLVVQKNVDLMVKKDADLVIDSTMNFWSKNRYCFSKDLVSMPLLRSSKYSTSKDSLSLDTLRESYHKIIDNDAQIVVSAIKILALSNYLSNKGFDFVFLDWENYSTNVELAKIHPNLSRAVRHKTSDIKSLGTYADENNLRIPGDGHPQPDAHLYWTKQHLIPFMMNLGYLESTMDSS